MPHRLLAAALATLALAACSTGSSSSALEAYSGVPPRGAPLSAAELPLEQWSFIPFPGTTCGDGSPAAVAVNRGSGPDLLVFLDGGGACWDYASCAAGTAVDAAYGAADWGLELRDYVPSSITDRSHLPPSLAGATVVFVPYCTGDVHGGDRLATYRSVLPGLPDTTWHHMGHANLLAFLERLGPTFPSPRRLVVAGSSAGGFGALVSYAALRWYWPDARGYLIDDSGPALVGGDFPAVLRSAFYASWSLGEALDPVCAGCRSDLSAAFSALSVRYPADRIAFLSHLRDPVMSAFTLSTPEAFEAALRRLEATVLAPTPNARAFYDSDGGAVDAHMLLTPSQPSGTASYVATHVEGGLTLADWLEQMVSDDPRWASVVPPG